MAPRRGRGPLERRPLRPRRRRARRPPTPRSPRCASAARRATTAWPPASSTTTSATAGSPCTCSRCAGRCAWSRATPRSRSPRCASRARPTGAGWPAGGPRGCRRGRGAGRWAPAARSTSARARSTRSTRELREEWSVAPERVQVEALVRLPHRLVMLVGQAWLPEGAEVTPDDEHDALRLVAGVDRRLAARGRRAAAAHGRPAAREPARFDTLKRLSFTHSAIYLTLLVGLDRARACTRSSSSSAWRTAWAGSRCASCTLAAVRARVIPLRLGVAVAVIGAVGPFVGSYEFVREERRRRDRRRRPQSGHGRTGTGEASIRAY